MGAGAEVSLGERSEAPGVLSYEPNILVMQGSRGGELNPEHWTEQPLVPGSATYHLGTPQFPQISVSSSAWWVLVIAPPPEASSGHKEFNRKKLQSG